VQLLSPNLLAIAVTDAKLFRQLLQPEIASLIDLQKLATQIIRIRSWHGWACGDRHLQAYRLPSLSDIASKELL
jgi:hypothetical protein